MQSLRLDAVRVRQKNTSPKVPPQPEKNLSTIPAPIFATPGGKSDELKSLISPRSNNLARIQKAKKSFWLKKKFWAGLLIAITAAGLVFGIYKFAQFGQKIFAGKSPLSFLSSFGQLFSASDRKLSGEEQGAVNILLLGIGGEGHEGANLTDTIILASIKPQTPPENTQVSLLSIPRDLIAKLPENLNWRKINSAYAYGEFKQAGLGAAWITDIMKNLSGEQIPYYAVIDFSGFRQAIDDLGGVDVDVETAFKDSAYPDYKGGYIPTVSFAAGLQHMTGERALQFTRSRHGTNGEGSDFARSKRQQKILLAVKDKASKLKLSSISTISKLLNNFTSHFKTNFEPWEIKRLYDLLQKTTKENIYSLSLDPTGGIVCNMIDENTGAYILSYCPGKNSADLKAFIADRFTLGMLFRETPRVEFQNSTKVAGLAQKAEVVLAKYNMVTSTANFPDATAYNLTTIYDLTNGAKPQTLDYLAGTLEAYVATSSYPFAEKLPSPKPDFVVVLGMDAPSKIGKLYLDIQRRQTLKEPFSSDELP